MGCSCNGSDNGKVKLTPAFLSGYRGAEEAEDCSSLAYVPIEFNR
jgi:hypothetical protein